MAHAERDGFCKFGSGAWEPPLPQVAKAEPRLLEAASLATAKGSAPAEAARGGMRELAIAEDDDDGNDDEGKTQDDDRTYWIVD